MQLSAQTIFEAAMSLPENVRLDLAARLMDTIPGEHDLLSLDDPNLIEELDRRAADDAPGIPWSEVRNEKS